MTEVLDRAQPRIGGVVGGLLWALAGAGVCALAIPLEPNLLEEGLTLHIAQRIAAGEFLYRDMLVFTGPVPFELLGLIFRILGPDLMLGRWVDVVLHGSACAASFGIARRAGAGPLAHAAAASLAAAPVLLFPLFAIFFYTTVAVHLCILTAYAAVRGLRSPGWAVAAGCGAALAVLSKQTIGLVLVLGLFVSLPLLLPRDQRLRVLGAYVAGGIAVVLVTLAVYGARGDLSALLRGLVVLPLLLGDSFAAPYLNLWPIGDFSEAVRPSSRLYLPPLYAHTHGILDPIDGWIVLVAQALYALPIVALVATLLARWRRPLHAAVWIHAVLLLALFSNLFPRGDWGHLVFVLPSSLAQLVLLVPAHWRRAAWSLTGTLVIVLAAGVGLATDLLYGLAGKATYGARISPRPVSALLKTPGVPMVIYFLEKWARPGEPIFVARSEPLIYFATGRTNPTPYSGVVPGIREEQERTILEALRSVRFVVMSDIDQPVYTYYRKELPAVQKYLERYYRPIGRQGGNWILLLSRGPDRGPTAIDLFDQQASARAWIRDANGIEIPPPRELPTLATRLNRRPLPMLLGPRGGGIDFEIELPERAMFQADVGLEGLVGLDNLYRHPRNSTLVVSVRSQGEFEEAARFRPLEAKKRQLFWIPVQVDLSRWGGSRVTLRLELVPEREIDPEELSWWGSPRIVVAPRAN
ncbi:MAG: glycosyltransferase family 39 protein [Myxococcales bacterium]|nr:glycosyltransferase family 39 protein [Myxococcales bacterium]